MVIDMKNEVKNLYFATLITTIVNSFKLLIANGPQVLVTEWVVKAPFHLFSSPLQLLLDIPGR